MGKVLRQKPGPKSSKESKILSHRGTLGETSCESSEDDDSSPEDTLSTPATPETRNKKSYQQTVGNASEFRTPDAEVDATDYGLEFTTSHIQNPSPRRCSTLKNAPSSQEEQQSGVAKSRNKSNKENETPASSIQAKSPRKPKPLKKVSKQQSTKTKSKTTPNLNNEKQATSAGETPGPGQKQVARKPRKQRNPIQLERRFWKDVKVLQNRTDNLIPLLPFSRLVREIMQDCSTEVTKITPTALEAFQTASELYLTQRLQDAYMLTLHRGRVTLDVRDMQMINYLKMNL